MPSKFPLRIRFFTRSLPSNHLASLKSGARAYHSSSSVPFLFRIFSFRLDYFAIGSRINFSTSPNKNPPEFERRSRDGGEIRASKSLIEDEEEISNLGSDFRTGSLRFRLTSDDDESGPDMEDRSRGRNQDRRGIRNKVDSFRDKRYGDRESGLNGRSQGKRSQGSFLGRKETSLDSGFRRDRKDYKGSRKREDFLEDESSDEDVKSLLMGGIGDLLSEVDEDEDEDYEFLKKKATSAFGFDKEKVREADKARNADGVKTSDSYLTKTR